MSHFQSVAVAALLFVAGCAATYERELVIYPDNKLVSESAKQAYAGKHVHGRYRVRLDGTRRVKTFEVVKSIPGADDAIRQVFAETQFNLDSPLVTQPSTAL